MQSSGQVGAALILAVVTALVAGGAGGAAEFAQFRPGFNLVTAVAATGLALNLIPLLNRRSAARRS